MGRRATLRAATAAGAAVQVTAAMFLRCACSQAHRSTGVDGWIATAACRLRGRACMRAQAGWGAARLAVAAPRRLAEHASPISIQVHDLLLSGCVLHRKQIAGGSGQCGTRG